MEAQMEAGVPQKNKKFSPSMHSKFSLPWETYSKIFLSPLMLSLANLQNSGWYPRKKGSLPTRHCSKIIHSQSLRSPENGRPYQWSEAITNKTQNQKHSTKVTSHSSYSSRTNLYPRNSTRDICHLSNSQICADVPWGAVWSCESCFRLG